MQIDNEVRIRLMELLEERRKQAAMDAQAVQQEAGPMLAAAGDPSASAGAPIDPNTGQPMPPVDPATGQPMDPAMAGAAPMVDPATGQPMDPAMAGVEPPPQPTIEELVATGDPVVKLLVELRDSMKVIVDAFGQLMDQSGMTVPASKALETEVKATEADKKASSPDLVDDDDPDFDENLDVPLSLQKSEPVLKLGSAAMPGEGAGARLETGFEASNARNTELAKLWRR